MTIIYITIAFVAGIILALIIKGGKKKQEQDGKLTDLEAENQRLKSSLDSAEREMSAVNKQLKNAISGNIDDVIKERLDDAEKLKKKIEDLEEEVEEKEDDIDDLKKKIKNKGIENTELQDSLDKEQKKSRGLSDELSSTKLQLEEKVEDLKLKKGSLDFVQEILSATKMETPDTNKLNKYIDIFGAFVKGQFTDLNTYLFEEYGLSWGEAKGKVGLENKKKYFHDTFEQWASTKRKSWLDGKTTIAFVGEFSAGKTSIVNRILSLDNPNVPRLPVSTKATTAIPTYIAGGSTKLYHFISGDGKQKTISEDTFKKVSKEVLDQVKGVTSLIKYLVMTYKNPNLDGLSILDTPGFNSNDNEDRERTIDVINECDALFWVFDVNAGTVNRSSISIIKEKLSKPLFVVINKVDTKADSEVQKVEDLIKKTLAEEKLQVQQFIRFSARAPLSNIMDPIKGVYKIAARDTFVKDVEKDIKQSMKILEDAVKSANKSYNNVAQEGENITSEISDCKKDLKNDCKNAKEIPHLEKHFFHEDRYEMTREEYYELKEILNQIAERVESLTKKINDYREKTAEIQEKWSKLCDLKADWQKANDCLEEYKKVSKIIA